MKTKKSNKWIYLVFVLACIGAILYEKRETVQTSEPVSAQLEAMDTVMTIDVYGEEAQKALDTAVAEIRRLDALFSVGNADSDIAILNRDKTAVVSEDTFALIKRAIEISRETQGASDITVYSLMDAWGFVSKNYRVPSEEEIRELLAGAQIDQITCDEKTRTVTLPEDTMIDLGSIAKGYTSKRLAELIKEYDVACAMINLGGNAQLVGKKTNGDLWKVGIENPFDEGADYLGVVSVSDAAVITSGAYHRYFEKDGQRYHHILDPHTGYPADNDLASVSVVSQDGTLADALSTALFVMGGERAVDFWREHASEFDLILIDKDGNISITEGIKDRFTCNQSFRVIE